MTSRRQRQPLDRVAPLVMFGLTVVIVAMLIFGSQALPRVRNFSWQNQPVKADDVAFLLTFTQPMEPDSVEQNLNIEPKLSGKFSWAGRRMAYTLDAPAPYGETFKLSLPTAEALSGPTGFEAFEGTFRSRDRAFVYIGVGGEETDRLVLFNLTKKEKTLLTAANQTVLDFQPYPGRDRILYSAVDSAVTSDRLASAQLYTVTTGLDSTAQSPAWQFWRKNTLPEAETEAGITELILDNSEFQNLKFDLSADGETIVVQRVSQENPSNFGPWVIRAGEDPRKLKTEPGGDFKIAPDSVSLLLQQGRGTAVIDLEPETTAAESEALLLDFLPEYGLTLDIATDGASAALVNFNQDDPEDRFTQSLYWVSNRGDEKLLLQTNGAILSAQFNDNNQILYCLVNRLLSSENTGEDYDNEALIGRDRTEAVENFDENNSQFQSENQSLENDLEDSETEIDLANNDELAQGETEFFGEENAVGLLDEAYSFSPYLTAINIETGQTQKLIEMPPQPEITVSLSPDGLAVLFDEALVDDAQNASLQAEYDGPTHRLWLLPLFSTLEERINREPIALPPTELDIAGRHPIWLP